MDIEINKDSVMERIRQREKRERIVKRVIGIIFLACLLMFGFYKFILPRFIHESHPMILYPAGDGGFLFATRLYNEKSRKGWIRLEKRNAQGKKIWRKRHREDRSVNFFSHMIKYSDVINQSVLLTNPFCFLVFEDRKWEILNYSTETGQLVWSTPLPSIVAGGKRIIHYLEDDMSIYIYSDRLDQIISINKKDGAVKWVVESEQVRYLLSYSSPELADDYIVLRKDGIPYDNMFISKETGDVISAPDYQDGVVWKNGIIYTTKDKGSEDISLRHWDAKNRKAQKLMTFGDQRLSFALYQDQVIYFDKNRRKIASFEIESKKEKWSISIPDGYIFPGKKSMFRFSNLKNHHFYQIRSPFIPFIFFSEDTVESIGFMSDFFEMKETNNVKLMLTVVDLDRGEVKARHSIQEPINRGDREIIELHEIFNIEYIDGYYHIDLNYLKEYGTLIWRLDSRNGKFTQICRFTDPNEESSDKEELFLKQDFFTYEYENPSVKYFKDNIIYLVLDKDYYGLDEDYIIVFDLEKEKFIIGEEWGFVFKNYSDDFPDFFHNTN